MCIKHLFQFLASHEHLINVNFLPPIFLFNKYLLNVCSVPSTVLGTKDTKTKKRQTVLPEKELLVQWGELQPETSCNM